MEYITITKTEYSEMLSTGVVWTTHGLIYLIKALDQTHHALLVKNNDLENAKVVNLHWKGKTTFQV